MDHRDGHANGTLHTVRLGEVSPGDVHRRAVVHARANGRNTEGDVHAFLEGDGLDRDQALVVVHGDHDVRLALDGPAKHRVGGQGPHGVDALGASLCDGRGNDRGVLAAETAALARVTVDAADGDSRLGDSEESSQGVVGQTQRAQDPFGADRSKHLPERHVNRGQHDAERSAGEHHRHALGAELLGKEFRVPRPGIPGLVNRHLVDRPGDHAVEPAGLKPRDGGQDVADARLAAGRGHLAHGNRVVVEVGKLDQREVARRAVVLADRHHVEVELRQRRAAGRGPESPVAEDDVPGQPPHGRVTQGLGRDLGPDARRVADGDGYGGLAAHADSLVAVCRPSANAGRGTTDEAHSTAAQVGVQRRTPIPAGRESPRARYSSSRTDGGG